MTGPRGVFWLSAAHKPRGPFAQLTKFYYRFRPAARRSGGRDRSWRRPFGSRFRRRFRRSRQGAPFIHRYMKPGIEKREWSLELCVTDPFNNRIRFMEQA